MPKTKRISARIGRPPAEGVARDIVIQIRVTEQESTRIARAAGAVPVSTWMRGIVLSSLARKPTKAAKAKKVHR